MTKTLFLKKTTGQIRCEHHKDARDIELSQQDLEAFHAIWQGQMIDLGLEEEYRATSVWDELPTCEDCDWY